MQSMRLMLVDDETRFLQTTKKLLEKKGFEILTAESGMEALKILAEKTVDVVILDVKMPQMDGLETLKNIKRDFPLTEVIMLTGHGTVDSAVEGMKSGATDFINKPADIDDLLSKAQEAYEKRLRLEEKIRMAQTRQFLKSPREIKKAADNIQD